MRIWEHRTTYGAPVLDLDQLEPDDQVVLTSPAEQFVDLVRSVDVVGPNEPVGASLDPTLVLSTPYLEYASRQGSASRPTSAPAAPRNGDALMNTPGSGGQEWV